MSIVVSLLREVTDKIIDQIRGLISSTNRDLSSMSRDLTTTKVGEAQAEMLLTIQLMTTLIDSSSRSSPIVHPSNLSAGAIVEDTERGSSIAIINIVALSGIRMTVSRRAILDTTKKSTDHILVISKNVITKLKIRAGSMTGSKKMTMRSQCKMVKVSLDKSGINLLKVTDRCLITTLAEMQMVVVVEVVIGRIKASGELRKHLLREEVVAELLLSRMEMTTSLNLFKEEEVADKELKVSRVTTGDSSNMSEILPEGLTVTHSTALSRDSTAVTPTVTSTETSMTESERIRFATWAEESALSPNISKTVVELSKKMLETSLGDQPTSRPLQFQLRMARMSLAVLMAKTSR